MNTKMLNNTQSPFASHHLLLLPVGLGNELFLLSSTILTSQPQQDESSDNSCTHDNSPGENVLFQVLGGPEEKPNKDSQGGKNRSNDEDGIKSDLFTVEGIVVIRHGLPDGIGLAETALILISVEDGLSCFVV